MIIVNINIDTLMLEGFSHHDAKVFNKTLKKELLRIMSKNGVQKDRLFSNHELNIDRPINLLHSGSGSQNKAQSAGVEVAMSIYKSLIKERSL